MDFEPNILNLFGRDPDGYNTEATSSCGQIEQCVDDEGTLPESSRVLDSGNRPRNRAQFLTSLPPDQINKIIRPIQRGVLDPNTVFSITDASGRILPISGQEVIDILQCGNDDEENLYEPEPVIYYSWHSKFPSRKKLMTYLLLLVAVFEAVTIAGLGVSSIWIRNDEALPNSSVTAPNNTYSRSVLIVGGLDGTWHNTDTIEEYFPYNTSRNTILNTTLLLSVCGGVSAFFNDSLLVAGGWVILGPKQMGIAYALQWLNFTTDKIAYRQNMETFRADAAGISYKGNFYVCGGRGVYEPYFFKSCIWLDLAQQMWFHIHDMNNARAGHSIVEYDGHLYVFGGRNATSIVHVNEVYNPLSNHWTVMEATQQLNSFLHSSVVYNGGIVLCGGFADIDARHALSRCEFYSDKDKQWMLFPQMKQRRAGVTLVNFHNDLLAFGGGAQEGLLENSVERFIPGNMSWTHTTPFLTPRWRAMVVVYGEVY